MYTNIYTPMQHLRRPVVNPGGLCMIAFARWEDVLYWPRFNPISGVLDTAIVLRENTTWFRLNPVDRGRVFEETHKVDATGHYMDISVQGELPDDNINLHLSVKTMRYHQYVLLVKDRCGLYRLIGNKDSGAEVSPSYTSGDVSAGRKRTIVFSWQLSDPVPVYIGPEVIEFDDGEYIPPVAARGDFNSDFSDDFFTND